MVQEYSDVRTSSLVHSHRTPCSYPDEFPLYLLSNFGVPVRRNTCLEPRSEAPLAAKSRPGILLDMLQTLVTLEVLPNAGRRSPKMVDHKHESPICQPALTISLRDRLCSARFGGVSGGCLAARPFSPKDSALLSALASPKYFKARRTSSQTTSLVSFGALIQHYINASLVQITLHPTRSIGSQDFVTPPAPIRPLSAVICKHDRQRPQRCLRGRRRLFKLYGSASNAQSQKQKQK